MYKFLIVIEQAKKNFSAYSPDLPGCVATGKTVEEAERNMHEAIKPKLFNNISLLSRFIYNHCCILACVLCFP